MAHEDNPLSLSDKQLQAFGKEFLEKYLAHGYGTMPKREIDILVFHLISKSPKLESKRNYDIANELRLTETKVKALRLEASLKHKPAIHKAVVGNIISRLVDEVQKPSFSDGEISVSLEDPVEKREFEFAVKENGSHVEYGINREILKIKPLQLFELIISTLEDGEAEFERLVRAHINSEVKQQEIMDGALTFSEKAKKFYAEIGGTPALIGLIIQAATTM